MSKNYAVHMDGDRIEAIEVGGTIYARLEDIPNARDREQIQRLIQRSERANIEGGLEGMLADELGEMKRRPAPVAQLLVAVFLGITALLLAVAVFSGVSAARQMAREVSAPGRVVDLVERVSRDSNTGAVSTYAYPVVEFTPAGRPPRTARMEEGSWPPSYAEGDRVTVLYDPERPSSARIQSGASTLLLWLLPGVTLLVGLVFGGVALAVLRLWDPFKMRSI